MSDTKNREDNSLYMRLATIICATAFGMVFVAADCQKHSDAEWARAKIAHSPRCCETGAP